MTVNNKKKTLDNPCTFSGQMKLNHDDFLKVRVFIKVL